MCGLTGVFSSNNGLVTTLRTTVSAMAAQLQHRGPDAVGVWVADGVALGHQRLAILDLSPAGAQPMHSACGRYVIAFNGEIYNHLSLRHQLIAAGVAPVWRGHSDTETLLAATVYWGIDETLKRAEGMFALALWDRKIRCLTLARDRIGEKPLYWGWAGTDLVFGSELKALRQHPDFSRAICRDALAQYLRFAYVPAPRSIHPGVYKLEPGCVLKVSNRPPTAPPRQPMRPGDRLDTLTIQRYWSLNEIIEAGAQSQFVHEDEAIASLENTLSGAVSRQMVADVPLGAFLSGGIDSSLIVALMQQQSSLPIQTFTVGFENTTFNEAPYAAAVARHLGTDHTELTVTEKEAQEVIPQLPKLYDEPFADASQIPTHLVCRAARSQVTVVLSGDAGDEVFGGYNRYVRGPVIWNRISRLPVSIRQILATGALAIPKEFLDCFGWMYNCARPDGLREASFGDKIHRIADQLRRIVNVDDLHLNKVSFWLDPHWLLSEYPKDSEPLSLLGDSLPVLLNNSPADRMMAQDMRSYLPDDILCKVDRAAMGVSLETRMPFLDPNVLNISARLTPRMKIRDCQGKWALRQILYRHIPKKLIERPKAGFGIPVGDWLRGPFKPWANDLLSYEALKRSDLVMPAPVIKAWEEHRSGRRDWTHHLWIILMLQQWVNSY